jgi:glycosyltransferase involved in cell wall biosynthesis
MSLQNKVDVIIPSKSSDDNWPMVVKTIQSLRLSEPWFDFNVVLVESGELKNCGQNLTIDYEDKRFSYNRALNKGIAQTKADWVVMANNDLWFHAGWFSEIIKAWVDNPDIKSFSPWNNYHNWHPRLFPENKSSVLIGSRICRELAGWCIVARREMIETIDIDERCSLWFSDNIYADELEKHGYHHALVCSSLVDHLTSQTIDFSKYDTLEDQKLYFEGKK